jgi:23S rRNA pseudouridine2605 synthase
MKTKRRLSHTLAAAGIASRRAAEKLIFAGRVSVNGQIVCVPQTLVTLGEDRILVDEKLVSSEEKKVYYILNKPTGFICSSQKESGKKIVLDLFQSLPYRLFTIGRLDRDTSGLLLVTNDGYFAQRVIHPSSNIQKEYLVKTFQEIQEKHLIQISRGMWIENGFVKPVKVVKVRRGTLKITVMEGKKREVRLLVQKAGLDLLQLTRIRIGGLHLGSLPEGAWKEMSHNEKEVLFSGNGPRKKRRASLKTN